MFKKIKTILIVLIAFRKESKHPGLGHETFYDLTS